MVDIGIPELTSEQLEELCGIAEEAAIKHVLSKVSSRRVSTLNINVNSEGAKPITVNVDVEVALSPMMKGCDVERLVRETVERAFDSVEKYLRGLACTSKK